jgi:carboxypeptidase Q
MIEVMRILKALNLKLDRTVRLALWGGEEQGLRGSRAYIQAHFADPVTMDLKPEHGKLSGYFNLDNGSGKIRGVYLQGNEAMRPLFEQWLAPFRDLGVTTVTIRDTGGTDHLSFTRVGLPGFQFIQDSLDYGTLTHHTSADTYDHGARRSDAGFGDHRERGLRGRESVGAPPAARAAEGVASAPSEWHPIDVRSG